MIHLQPLLSARAKQGSILNGNIRSANESNALKMNIIVIL